MVIVTGAAGQLGTDLIKELKRRGIEHAGIDIEDLDITDEAAVLGYFRKYCRAPGSGTGNDGSKNSEICVIHCAAYTAVDKAEDEPELCFDINAKGTEYIAKACREIDAEMIHISTDYVFDGKGLGTIETDAVKNPLSAYGKSKMQGEISVAAHLSKYYIVRIAWAFGLGGANFVKTMIRLAETKEEINVVCDQFGSPTYTADLSQLLCDMAFSKKYGIYHATNEGFCSWAEFAQEIMRLTGKKVKINSITTDEYPTKAIRPKNSRMSKKSLTDAGFKLLPPWQDALKRYLDETKD